MNSLAFIKAVFMSMLVEEMVGDEKRDLLLLFGPCTGESEQGKSVEYILHCNVNTSL